MARPPLPRTALRLAAVASTLALVLGATLVPDGEPLVPRHGEPWCLVCGPNGGADVVRNVLLFLPLGIALAAAGLRARSAVAAAFATTLLIELAQLTLVGGRAATVSDVVANTAGALLGALLAVHATRFLRPGPAAARRLAALGAAGFLVASAAGAWLATPAPVPAAVETMWLPAERTLVRPYEGHVERATLNGRLVVRDGAVVERPALRSLREPIVVTATVNAMLPPGLLRPFVAAFAPTGEDLLVVGQRGRRLVLRVRTNGSRLRLHGPQLELPDAFPAAADVAPGADPRRGPVVRARVELRDGMVRMHAEGAAGSTAWQVPLSPHLAWVLAAGPLRLDPRTVTASALWLAALLAPVAYWACLGWPRRRTPPIVLVLAALALVATAAAARMPPPAWWEWLGAGAGVGVGTAVARLVRVGRRGPGARPR